MNLIKAFLLLIACMFNLSSCSLNNKQNGDRIFLDFYLGMSYSQFNEHRKELQEKGIARTEPSYNESNEFKLEFYFIKDIKGVVFDRDLTFQQINDEKNRLTKMSIKIRRDTLITLEMPSISTAPYHRAPYTYSGEGYISSIEKKELTSIFIEKYGKSQVHESTDLIWAFPTVQEPKYICRLDTVNMLLSYYYNNLYLLPLIDKRKNKELELEKNKTKNAI